jgi:hypothetical protein
MMLDELTALAASKTPPRVPDWTLGCFRRRSITYFTGVCDGATRVFWLQSHGLTADLRLVADFPVLAERPALEDLSDDLLMALAEAEGGIAETAWDGTQMSWGSWTAFQLHDKWPEPAVLKRVGDSLIEFAPSGVYVEDWRLQPSAPGLLVGLKLIEERDLGAQDIRHRGGGLIVCGDYAAFIRGRPVPLTGGRLPDLVRAARKNAAALNSLFAFECSYAERDSAGAFKVALSTRPWRASETLIALDGFSYDAASGSLTQRVSEDGIALERRFTIETLRADFTAPLSTPATGEAKAWLKREHGL